MNRITIAGLLGWLASIALAQAAPSTVMRPASDAALVQLDPALASLVAPGTRIAKMATGFAFLEGPMWHDGAIWFSDLRDDKMYRVSPDGQISMMLDHAGGLAQSIPGTSTGSNAMVAEKDGNILMEQHGARRIVRLDRAMHTAVFLDRYQGKRFNSPNDMVFAPDGALWFTDPPYGFSDPAHPDKNLDKDPAKEIPFNGVYRYKNGRLTAAITDLPRPNGIGFSPDGKTLYISNTENTPKILGYPVSADGGLGKPKTLIDFAGASGIGVPDGLKIDSKGDIWATGPGGIRVISPRGKVLGQIQLPEVAANLAWGGSDRKTLYITASTSLYRLRLLVDGEKPLYSN